MSGRGESEKREIEKRIKEVRRERERVSKKEKRKRERERKIKRGKEKRKKEEDVERWTQKDDTSRISLILVPPFPMREPHCELWMTSRKEMVRGVSGVGTGGGGSGTPPSSDLSAF